MRSLLINLKHTFNCSDNISALVLNYILYLWCRALFKVLFSCLVFSILYYNFRFMLTLTISVKTGVCWCL